MKRILENLKIAILIANGFEHDEMTKPRKALEEAGANTFIISPEKDVVKSFDLSIPSVNGTFPIDIHLEDAKAQEFDALVLPGGVKNPDTLRMNPKAVTFVKQFANKPIAAICHGPWTLIDAQLIKGKTVTSYLSIKNDLINAGAHWIDQEVVTDKNLVTSRKPSDIPAFNKAIIELFAQIKKK